MKEKRVEAGDNVRFRGDDGDDEREALYRVLDVDGENVVIEFFCDLPIPLQSTAKSYELKVVEEN